MLAILSRKHPHLFDGVKILLQQEQKKSVSNLACQPPSAARGALVQTGQCSYCEFYNVHFKGYLKEVELKAQQI